jgi:hypothetical protein
MPPDPRDCLPEGHLAWFVLASVEEMDLAAFYGEDAARARIPCVSSGIAQAQRAARTRKVGSSADHG